VGGTLDLRDTNILELPPDLEAGGSIYLLRTPIEKLPNNLTVNGRLDLEGCKNITSLPSGLKVDGALDLRDTNITELPPDLEVGTYLVLFNTPLSRNYSRDQIRKMIPKVKGEIL
jgi:Leucine-rich repeat (LRR) protein